ncbi:hypothetical protein VPHK406_0132 [Vibrio phage K406]
MYDVIECSSGRLQYNVMTGEILEDVVYTNENYSHKEDVLSLSNTNERHYYLARDVEELVELCQYSIYDSRDMPIKHDEKLFCLLSRGMIPANTFYLFSLLSKRIQRRNVAVMSKDELIKIIGTDNKNFSREVKRLESSGVMKFIAPQGTRHKQRNILFHPSLVWRGDYGLKYRLERSVLASNTPWYEVDNFDVSFEEV